MSENRRFGEVWLWLCIAFGMPLTRCDAADIAQATGEVAGRIVDQAGDPVGGATVRIQEFRGDEVLATGTCDREGQFKIRDVPAARRLRVFVDAEGMGREHRDDVAVFPGRTTDLGTIRAFPGCVWRGRVVDPEGKPVAGVDVVIRGYMYELGHTIAGVGPPWQIKTDAEGRFASPGLPPCLAMIADLKLPPGLVATRYVRDYIRPNILELNVADIQLEPEALLEGTVTDSNGQPVGDAEVWYSPGDPDSNSTRTDADGHFELHGLSGKTIHKARVGVEAKGLAAYAEEEPKDELPRKIVLAPCGYISGRAVDVETGEPVQLKRVIVCEVRRDDQGRPQSYGCGEGRMEQPRTGEFRVLVSTAGEKHLTVMADGYDRAEEYVLDFDFRKGGQEIVLKLRRHNSRASVANQRIRGVVRRGGQPAADVWVSLWQKHDEWNTVNSWMLRGRTVDGTYRPWVVDVLTGGDGCYVLDVADPGDYYVVADPLQGAPAISEPLRLEANAEQTCDLELQPGGTIRGRVVGVGPDVSERLWVVAFGHTPFRAATPVDRDGQFVLRDVPAGEIGLKVGHDGYLDADVPRYPWPGDAYDKLAEPWKRAVTATVRSGASVDGVELGYPPAGPPDGEVE